MKTSFSLYILSILTGLILAGCNSSKTSSSSATPPTATPAAAGSSLASKPPQEKCLMPDVLKNSNNSSVGLNDLEASLSGQYELGEVHVFSAGKKANGQENGAFYATARRYIGTESVDGVSGMNTKLSMDCLNLNSDQEDTPFISGITIPVAGAVHFPSGRITVFDVGSNKDNATYNFPTLIDLHFDTLGYMTYSSLPESEAGHTPYVKNLYLADLASMWSHPNFSKTANGFEVRFSRDDTKDAGNGKSFTTTTTVLITYKPSVD